MKLITVKDYTTKNILYKNLIFKIIFTIFTFPVQRGTVSNMGTVSPTAINLRKSYPIKTAKKVSSD
jgi:hypothetical protein